MELLFTDIDVAIYIYIYRYFLKYKSAVWFKYFFHRYNQLKIHIPLMQMGLGQKPMDKSPPPRHKWLHPGQMHPLYDNSNQTTIHLPYFFLCLCLTVQYVNIFFVFYNMIQYFFLPFYFNSLYSLYLNLNHIYLYLCTHFGLIILLFIG